MKCAYTCVYVCVCVHVGMCSCECVYPCVYVRGRGRVCRVFGCMHMFVRQMVNEAKGDLGNVPYYIVCMSHDVYMCACLHVFRGLTR